MTPEADLEWMWIAKVVAAVAISALVPIAMMSTLQAGKKVKVPEEKREEDEDEEEHEDQVGTGLRPQNLEPLGDIQAEPWVPKLEVREWQQACQLAGCPWSFDACEDLPEVLDTIWRQPLCKELQTALEALKPRVKSLQVAKVSLTMPPAVHFVIIYKLITGAEIFGGAPLEHAVGLELGEDPDRDADGGVSADGFRRRRGSSTPSTQTATEGFDIPLPALLPFYRIHDGIGILLTSKHLPVLLGSPGDTVDGSYFYVYPARGLEPHGNREGIVRFARVDRLCSACADCREEVPTVIYIEKSGQQTPDDEQLLPFIADTVSSIAGQRIVPPSYMGGPKAFPNNVN